MNPARSPDNGTNVLAEEAPLAKYRLAVRSAFVAGLFSAVVAGVLLFNFSRRVTEDPLNLPQYQAMKVALQEQPENEALKAELRERDLQLRKAYFRQRRLTATGSWLLLAGVAVFLIAARAAVKLRERLPMPEPPPLPHDSETKVMAAARWSVAALAALLVAASALLIATVQSELPAGIEGSGLGEETGESGFAASVTPSAVADFASDEEMEANWPRFRGPGGSGISMHKDVPTTWDAASGEGILWKTAVPLPGNNSPVLWEGRVFLSGASEQRQEVYCFDADSGELVWRQEVPMNPQAAAEPPEVMEDTGFAAPTTATDGRRVYAMFATGDVGAVDFDGRLAWSKSLGVPDNAYGHAASLATFRNLLLIQFDQGSAKDALSKMIALEGATGEKVWEAPRDVANSWPSPIVARTGDGSHQLITASDPWVIAYDPADGRELWRSKSLQGDVGPSPVFADGIAYVANEFPGAVAIRADGQGDVTETHVLWEGEDGVPDTCSPLVSAEFVLLAASYGFVTCYDAKSGEILWEEEFEDATFTSSPSLVEDRMYLFSEEGRAWVVKPTREGCERIGEAELAEECVTSPAFRDGRLYIRGKEHLFCIGSE